MANRTATLIRYAKIPGLGWRRGTLIKSKNNQYKPGVMKYDDKEFEAKQGVYQIRTYKGKTAVHVSVGNDLAVAEVLLKKHIAVLKIAEHQAELGIPPTEDESKEERKNLTELAEAFITDKLAPSQGLSRTSTRLYERTLRGFVFHAKRLYATEVTKADITGFMDVLMLRYSQKSRVMRYTVVRSFLQSCGVDLKALIDAATHKRLKAKPDADTTPYTKEQLEKLFAVCSPYYSMVFTLLLKTGMRFREASHLTWSNIKWGENKIFVPGEQRITVRGKMKTFETKSRKGRSIPLYPSLKAALLEWRKQHPDTIYVVGTTGLRLSDARPGDQPNNHWLEYVKKYWREAGLNCGVCDGCNSKRKECEEAFLHRFRHTFAHRFLDKKPDLESLSRILGHWNISQTMVYLQNRTSSAEDEPDFANAA